MLQCTSRTISLPDYAVSTKTSYFIYRIAYYRKLNSVWTFSAVLASTQSYQHMPKWLEHAIIILPHSHHPVHKFSSMINQKHETPEHRTPLMDGIWDQHWNRTDANKPAIHLFSRTIKAISLKLMKSARLKQTSSMRNQKSNAPATTHPTTNNTRQ